MLMKVLTMTRAEFDALHTLEEKVAALADHVAWLDDWGALVDPTPERRIDEGDCCNCCPADMPTG